MKNPELNSHNKLKFPKYSKLAIPDIVEELHSNSIQGLSKIEAEKRLEKYGPNKIKSNEITPFIILKRQLTSPFIYLLLGAALIAFILNEQLDSLMILIFITLNTLLGFHQEFKSEKALKLLKSLIIKNAKVIRDHETLLLPVSEIVPGDLISLDAGDIVPADLRIVNATELSIDESILTGESLPVIKNTHVSKNINLEIYQAQNIAFSGTTVISGRASGIVIATGIETVFGNIAHFAFETPHVSNFQKGISKLSRFILYLMTITLILVIFANILIKGFHINIPDLLIFSIALAVSVIPEALPLVTTFSLAKGALHLAKHKVVVKRLSAIEDLGGIEILCTDKTGTLTEGTMTFSGTYAPQKDPVLFYANLAAHFLGRKGKKANDPFDLALGKTLSKDDESEFASFESISEIPFDPVHRLDAVLIHKNNKSLYIVRGAPEKIFASCPDSVNKEAWNWMHREGLQGKRILALAIKESPHKSSLNLKDLPSEMRFIGMVSFIDPLKKTTLYAIKKAEKIGLKIKILTGDSLEVAGAIGTQIGLIPSPDKVLGGDAWHEMTDSEKRKSVLENSVFARVTPQQKHEIINLLNQSYEVGFLGEGINDAPALKIASVGLVVKGAADISQEAADIILLEKSLHVIIEGIHEGRQVFINTLKYIKSTLTSNFGNFYAVAIASLLIDFLPMLPLQILLLNLLSDFPAISISTDTVDPSEIAKPQNYNLKEITLLASILGIISTIFDFIFFGLYYRLSPQILQTNWFIASIFTELVLLFSIRTQKIFYQSSKPSPSVIALCSIAVIITLILPFTTFGHQIFHFVNPQIPHLLTIIFIVAIYFFVSEFIKNLFYRYNSNLKNT